MIQSPRNSPLFGAIKAAAAAVAAGGVARSPAKPPAPPPSSPPEPFFLDGDETSEDYSSTDDDRASTSSASGCAEDVMEDLKAQMVTLSETATTVRKQMRGLCARAQDQAAAATAVAAASPVDWRSTPLKPRRPALKAWLEARGLSATPTLDAFFDACLAAALSADLESRVLTFSSEDAAVLTGGERRITVYDLMARLPTLFA